MRLYVRWGLLAAASSLLIAGCRSVPPAEAGAPRESAAQLKRELAEERNLARASDAHAHYARGVIHEMNDEQDAANEEYYRAALEDPGNDFLTLEVSRRFMENKQPERALEVVTRAAAQPNASGEVYARLGLIYAQLGRTNQAVSADRQAILRAPDSLTGYQNLYLVYLRMKQPQSALAVLDDAARRPTPDAEFLVGVAEMYSSYGLGAPAQKEATKAKALALLRRAEQLNPTSPPLRLKLADAFNLLGDTSRAARLYLDLLKHLPDAPALRERVRANLAEIYLQGSNHKLAAEQLEEIIREDPTNPQAYYFLGRFALEANKPAEAADNFSKMVLLSPEFEPAYYLLAMAQLDLNKPAEAVATLDKARQKFQPSFAMEFWTALALSRLKNYTEAIKHYTAAEVIGKATDPQQLDERFYFELGATCERKGDYAEAEKYFQKCLQHSPDFAEALNYLGYMWAEHGMKLDKARELIEKAVKAEPKNAAYLDSLAWVLFKLNQPKQALTYALKAVDLCDPPDATLFDHVGDIYAALNQWSKAQEAWRKSLALEPNADIRKKLDAAGGKSSIQPERVHPAGPAEGSVQSGFCIGPGPVHRRERSPAMGPWPHPLFVRLHAGQDAGVGQPAGLSDRIPNRVRSHPHTEGVTLWKWFPKTWIPSSRHQRRSLIGKAIATASPISWPTRRM
ncbi:MAG TPA: tetratricopeptide repeat protein [Candidatus Acidoferrum sp.]|nr:tetratricopeptide repeat protein [Candidatus Acidoferrum sp.]